MAREIKQIAVVRESKNLYEHVYALCEDNTIWVTDSNANMLLKWIQLPEIPDDLETIPELKDL